MAQYEPVYGMPFRQVIALPTITTGNALVTLYEGPCYNAVWVEVHLEVANHPAIVVMNANAAFEPILVTSETMEIGHNEVWMLVLGALPEEPLTKGSHSFTVKVSSYLQNNPAIVSGYLVLHGIRRS